jgi:hypothetical protein
MRWARAHSKLAVVLGVCVLAAGGAVTAVLVSAGGDDESSAVATTGPYAPITVVRQKVRMVGGGVSRELDPGAQTHLTTNLLELPGRYRYQVTVANTSNLGTINSFEWYPPVGIRIVKVVGHSAGRCALAGLTGFGGNQFKTVLVHPNVTCDKLDMKPPSCTCLGDGGSVTIDFVADQKVYTPGVARLVSASLSFKTIPSYMQPAATQQNIAASQG